VRLNKCKFVSVAPSTTCFAKIPLRTQFAILALVRQTCYLRLFLSFFVAKAELLDLVSFLLVSISLCTSPEAEPPCSVASSCQICWTRGRRMPSDLTKLMLRPRPRPRSIREGVYMEHGFTHGSVPWRLEMSSCTWCCLPHGGSGQRVRGLSVGQVWCS